MIEINLIGQNTSPEELQERNSLPDWHNEASDVQHWRITHKNNNWLDWPLHFTLLTDKVWLPAILVEAGFFVSNSQVKKNRPDLWITLNPDTVHNVRIGRWADIDINIQTEAI